MIPKTTKEWVEVIANSELPAITSTAKMLDGFSNDDKSSLPNLSKAILHDQGLSSCLLKVANSTQRIGASKVSTVSRAAVVLGIRTVKNICLTAKLVDNLLTKKNEKQEVHDALMQLMANSFYAGMLAKMMVPQHGEETQEEVYLAAMLYRIGETAFLSKGGELAKKIVKEKEINIEYFDVYCENHLGTNFNELTKGLATNWNLSDLLLKSLDQPETRTDEVKVVYFADKLSALIAHPFDEESFEELLDDISKIMGITNEQLRVRIEKTREVAQQLLVSYGASVLKPKLKKIPTRADFISAHVKLKEISLAKEKEYSKDKLLLEGFTHLTLLAQSSKDPNDFLQLALKRAVAIFDLQKVMFFMKTEDKFVVKSRFTFNKYEKLEPLNLSVNITSVDNAIGKVIRTGQSLVLSKKSVNESPYLLGNELVGILDDSSIAFLPVKIGTKTLGVIGAQQFSHHIDISLDDLARLNMLMEHLSLCLKVAVHT
jgi:HD-like signal output (HDOD) protein